MYKIVFVVAVFAFALQGAFSSPVVENEVAAQQANSKVDVPKNEAPVNSVANKPAGEAAETVAPAAGTATTTEAPKSGASSTEMCLLLVQVSSLALVAKHMFL
ncbi:unnamed protein product [Macrosiphum euphorbiae]|uniref:Uncharacterized protein n=1 Tax=Macrosiphum euphorbiae TaxID=13131 RepID=A0AAV0VZE0_9HEMI|nr:unnamed protein product [Macrosiphum euphorbiae]